MIVGIDEVGRGPWAGPLVVGAVVLGDKQIVGLTDSKKLSKTKRETLVVEIKQKALAYGLGWVTAEEIDELGLSVALEVGCRRALEQITVPYNEIIIDGTVNLLKNTGKGPYVTTMKKADLLIGAVSAASILAKVARDDWMAEQDERYPGYDFSSHVGYGTQAHKEAIERLGLTPLHRRSFAPIAAFDGTLKSPKPPARLKAGAAAEDAAAKWLVKNDYIVAERNWKTKMCEIDIVAEKNDTWYFVEVKHRRSGEQGGGIEAITKTKLRQMRFAANVYIGRHRLDGKDARLAVITSAGDTFEINDLLVVE
jgi:ribonuclease HII